VRESKGGGAAFFDLDRTLISVNSGFHYARYERQRGRIGWRHYLQASLWVLLYHLSLMDMEKAYSRALAHYRGAEDEELDRTTRRWFREAIADRVQPGALDALERHRRRGEPTVLLTNSSCYLAKVASEAWRLDDWLANQFETDSEGRLTGRLLQPLCYGRGKVVLAEAWAADHDVDLDESTFYSDSYSDRPMLERVGLPRVVNPDPRLRWVARRRGWPILDWSR
jgi:HAD superfamily hydrolase (TIGR01490 family)